MSPSIAFYIKSAECVYTFARHCNSKSVLSTLPTCSLSNPSLEEVKYSTSRKCYYSMKIWISNRRKFQPRKNIRESLLRPIRVFAKIPLNLTSISNLSCLTFGHFPSHYNLSVLVSLVLSYQSNFSFTVR